MSTKLVKQTDIHVVTVSGVGPAGKDGKNGLDGAAAGIDDEVARLNATFSSQHIMELFNPFALSSFSISTTSAEMGNTVTSETLTWASNYPPDTVTIDNGIGAVTLPATSYVHSGQTITTARTYTLTMVRNGVTKTAQASIAFLNRIYWGVNAAQMLVPATIVAMSSQLSGSRGRSVTYDCSGGKYFYLAFPKRLGTATFKINNLSYSDVALNEVALTNGYGYSEVYYVYYCNVVQFGSSITVVVS